MTSTTQMTSIEVVDTEVILTRIFDAPRALVFEMWTNLIHLVRWWGPQTMRTKCEIDLRVGGCYRIVMHGPDGTSYPLSGKYLELRVPEYFIATVNWQEHPSEWFAMLNQARGDAEGELSNEGVWTVTFETVENRTRVTIRNHFFAASDRDAFVKTGMNEGWSESFEKLDALLEAER